MEVWNDQWKSGGDCGNCRREQYCGTECKAHRERVKAEKEESFKKIIEEFFLENKIINKRVEELDANAGRESASDDQHMESGLDRARGDVYRDALFGACDGEP